MMSYLYHAFVLKYNIASMACLVGGGLLSYAVGKTIYNGVFLIIKII